MKKKKEKSNTTLRSFLIPAFVIIFFLGVLSAYYAMLFSQTKQKIIKSGELSAISSSEQIDKYLTRGIDTVKLACYTLDNMIRAGNNTKEIHDYMVNQSVAVQNTTYVNSTGLYGYILGEYLDGVNWVPDDDYVPTERPWYIDARANIGRVAIVDPYIDAQTSTITITFCKTLCDAKSVAAMDFAMDELQIITEDIVSQSEADMEMVLDAKYNVIAHSDISEVGKSYISGEDTFGNALSKILRSNEDSYFSFKYDNEDYIVYRTTVSNDWLCLSVYNATKVYSQLWTTLIFTVVTASLVIAILLAIMISSNRKQEQSERLGSIVESLAAAIDAKDAYTNGHSARVSAYAKEISKRYGYSEKKQEEIKMMGFLHDVGKIGIPDAVINKPGKLDENEFQLIKNHPEIGSKILSKSTKMPTVGIRSHHEKYNGSGYPDGLSGKDIPEEARIIAVADAYDAMTSRRSYRDALPQDVVRKEIEKGKGIQFDPTFADIMLQMIDEDKNYSMRGD